MNKRFATSLEAEIVKTGLRYGRFIKKEQTQKVLGEFGSINGDTLTTLNGHKFNKENFRKIIGDMIEYKFFNEFDVPDQRELDALYAIIAFSIENDKEDTSRLLEYTLKGNPRKIEITTRGCLREIVDRTPAADDQISGHGISKYDTSKREIEGAYLVRRLYFFLGKNGIIPPKHNANTIQQRYEAIMEYFPPYIHSRIIPDIFKGDFGNEESIFYSPKRAVYKHFLNGELIETETDGSHRPVRAKPPAGIQRYRKPSEARRWSVSRVTDIAHRAVVGGAGEKVEALMLG